MQTSNYYIDLNFVVYIYNALLNTKVNIDATSCSLVFQGKTVFYGLERCVTNHI